MRTVKLLGLDFAALPLTEAASLIAQRPAGGPFAYVVTPNADHLVRLECDPVLREVYLGAVVRLLDSRVVFGLARLFGLRTPPVVTGSDLTERLLRHHLVPGERITIVGLSPDNLPRLVSRLGLAPPAHYDPPMGFEYDPAACAAAAAFVRDNPSRLVFLAVGSPRQERLAAMIAAAGGATGTGLCIGASLEFLAGRRRRAPRLVSRMGLEWLYRLASEPRRLARRYLVDSPRVITLLLRQRLRGTALRA